MYVCFLEWIGCSIPFIVSDGSSHSKTCILFTFSCEFFFVNFKFSFFLFYISSKSKILYNEREREKGIKKGVYTHLSLSISLVEPPVAPAGGSQLTAPVDVSK